MKKTISFMIIAVLLGTLTGKILYTKYKNSSIYFDRNKVYFLQEGVYSSKESLNSNTKNINPKLVISNNDKYYVYVGISRDENIIKKLKKVYKNKGYHTYQKEMDINNKEFLINVDQYDILLSSATKDNELLTIQDVVLSNYEQIIKG